MKHPLPSMIFSVQTLLTITPQGLSFMQEESTMVPQGGCTYTPHTHVAGQHKN